MPENLKPITKADFSSGINVTASPWHLKPTELLRATNVILSQDGGLSVRDGAVTVEQPPAIPATVASILDLQSLTRTNGNLFRFRITRELDGSQKLYHSGTPWQLLGTFDLAYDTPTLLNFLDQ